MRTHASIGLGVPEILLPKAGVDLHKWAVIACDQRVSNTTGTSDCGATL